MPDSPYSPLVAVRSPIFFIVARSLQTPTIDASCTKAVLTDSAVACCSVIRPCSSLSALNGAKLVPR